MSESRHQQHQLRGDSSPPDGGQAAPPPGLSRYVSAPGSFLSSFADSGAAARPMFLAESPSAASELSCKSTASASAMRDFDHCRCTGKPYGVGEVSAAGNSLSRHSSSPADLFSHSAGGFQVPRDFDFGSCSSRPAGTEGTSRVVSRRLKSHLSFSGRGGRLADVGERVGCSNSSDVTSRGGAQSSSYMSSNFSIGSWRDTSSNSIVFSAPSSKRAKDHHYGDIITLSNAETEFQFGIPNTALEMTTAMDKYLRLQHDQTPFKVRAKRGCATHPRSIAERERRSRISDKLKNLQELVPNMDKQTNTADMLDLAVKHIRGLQNQVQILQKEQENCKCKKR